MTKQNPISIWTINAIAGLALVIGAIAGCQPEDRDPFAQASFPCHEDEALVYAPQFGADRVGCVNVEDVR